MRLRQQGLRCAVLPLRLIAKSSYFASQGWFDSVAASAPIGKLGEPVPWWSYPATTFIAERITRDMHVLEFGAGYSTLWLAKRAASVVSVEPDRDWISLLQPRLPKNASILPFDETYRDRYGELKISASDPDAFDVLVIDGLDRASIALASHNWLSAGGVIIYDDFNVSAEKRWQTNARKSLEGRGFRYLPFYGLGPINDTPHWTCIFYRRENCFGI